MKFFFLFALLFISCFSSSVRCYGGDPLRRIMKARRSTEDGIRHSVGYSPTYVAPQDGLKEADMITALPGQPNGVGFNQYSGYVTVDPQAGRALFYYFVESQNSSTKPLVLWLNGGPGCSSFGNGAMMELGPFRVNSDKNTLSHNMYAWNNVANIIFLESPAGVGFSYSNTSSDYNVIGDEKTAEDSYTFLLNWLERFPEYKTRDFFITGESYAGHYVPQLAQKILQYNKMSNQTYVNLRGVAMGNAYIDFETQNQGIYDYFWTHALISDEIHDGITLNCNFSSGSTISDSCNNYTDQADVLTFGEIFIYDIYASFCSSSYTAPQISALDPCSDQYIDTYLNNPSVQRALHVFNVPYTWQSCNDTLNANWKDQPLTVLPIIEELMASGIDVWLYSGDTDGRVPVTSTRYAIDKLGTSIKTKWYPWYTQGEVGGYAIGYQNLTFVSIRGAGHFVPSYQPARALSFFTSFLEGKLPSVEQRN